MKPTELKTKIFLDSGDPDESRKVMNMLGFLDGQTTNPSLIIKNPTLLERVGKGIIYTKKDLLLAYEEIIKEIATIIPEGDISIEVYADKDTLYKEMVNEAHQMYSWIKNGRIKLPIIEEGIKAAEILSKNNMRLNMTLCFSQEQAASVYVATKQNENKTFVSPFIGRLNDIGIQGVDLIRNILRMYYLFDKKTEVLSASIRDLPSFLYCLYLGSDIITAPFKIIKEWYEDGMKLPNKDYDKEFFNASDYLNNDFKEILYKKVDLNSDLSFFNINHDLTNTGLEKFAKDWNAVIKK